MLGDDLRALCEFRPQRLARPLRGAGRLKAGHLVSRSDVVRFPVGNRDLEIIRVDLAEGEEAVSIVAVVYECGLERRLDAGNFGEINVTLYLLLGRRFEIEFFETVAVEHHHPRLFGVSGIDEHAFCHSGITPERAASAARKSAGGAILCARKPPAPGAIPPCNEGASVMGGLVRGALIGFGFLRSVSPGVATRRDGSRAADLAGVRRIAPPSAVPGWRTAVFSRSLLYRVNRSATMVSSRSYAGRVVDQAWRAKMLHGKTGLEWSRR